MAEDADAERHGLVAPHRIVYVSAGSSQQHERTQKNSRGLTVVGLLGLAMCAALVMLGSNSGPALAPTKPVALGEMKNSQGLYDASADSKFQKLDDEEPPGFDDPGPPPDDDGDASGDDGGKPELVPPPEEDDNDEPEDNYPHPPDCPDAKECLKSCLTKAAMAEADIDLATTAAKGYAECFINSCDDKQLAEGEKCKLNAEEFDECWESFDDIHAQVLNSMETCTVSISGDEKLKIDKFIDKYCHDMD